MPQKIVTQTRSLGGTLNNAGNVRHDKGHTLVHINHAQIGVEGGKVVVRNLGTGVGGNGKKGRLPYIGKAHKTHVRQQLQLQHHVPLLPLESGAGEPGHLPGGGGIVRIAPAAPSAPGENEVLAGGHVHDDLAGGGVPHHGAPGHLHNEGFAALAAHFSAQPVLTRLGGVFALVAEVQQGGQIVVDPEDHTAAVTAVAAVGAAGGDIFFPVEGHRTVAALAAADGDSNFIYKHSVSSIAHASSKASSPIFCFSSSRACPARLLGSQEE